MKKLFYFLVSIVLLVGLQLSCTQEELPGGVYGTVVDKESGEPIRSVGVELSPLGQKTVTGSDGQYEFVDVEAGTYNLFVTKTDYKEESISFEVKPAQKTKVDIQIVKLPPALKVLDDDRNEIKSLDFGASDDDVIRSFSLFNDGPYELEWQLAFSADWIKSVSKTEGVLASGTVQSLLVTIDRALLSSGQNMTTIHITSNSGNNQLTVTATNGFQPTTLNTFPATDVRSSSATLHGEIITDGTPQYTERGFVYSVSSMPTIDNCIRKLSTPLTGTKSFSTTVTNLVEGETYYVRAYAINAGKEAYSTNEISFVATGNALPKVTTMPPTATATSIISGGVVSTDTGYSDLFCGICYSNSNFNPTKEDNYVPATCISGAFTTSITNLTPNTIYYVRAFAENGIGITYGATIQVKTSSGIIKIYTSPIAEITFESALGGYQIVEFGGCKIDEAGICWSTSQNPTVNDKTCTAGITLGDFSCEMGALSAYTKYYVRAYAISELGITYGSQVSFTTLAKSDYVDLGLPSGTKWRDKNERGYYDFDTAKRVYGNRLPTKAQWQELKNLCTWKWTGSGYMVVGLNGNHIILPADGCVVDGVTQQYGTSGKYRSSESIDKDNATYLYFSSTSIGFSGYSSHDGYSVRLVQ